MKRKVKVVDAVMGAGKTTAAIQYIDSLNSKVNVMFVTPLLSECTRVIDGSRTRRFVQPDDTQFGTKGRHLSYLINKGYDIVCTHALFLNIGDDVIELLRENNYILILDEVMNVITQYNVDHSATDNGAHAPEGGISMRDFKILDQTGMVKVDENYKVVQAASDDLWMDRYADVKALVDKGMLYCADDTALYRTLPPCLFDEEVFSDIIILTYMFDSQAQSYYCQLNDIPFDYYHVEHIGKSYLFKRGLDKTFELEWKNEVRSLIRVCDKPTFNHIGDPHLASSGATIDTALSYNWYRTNTDKHEEISNLLFRFMRNKPASQRMYTTFKACNKAIRPKRISGASFVPLNAKATNDYSDRTACAYLVNRYMNPLLMRLFNKKGIQVNQDGYALSEMIQWIWRSAIRVDKPIDLYIPSHRMRTLFLRWLNN